MNTQEFDELLTNLSDQPSRVHNMFVRILKRIYEKNCAGDITRFLNECAVYLVSVTNKTKSDMLEEIIRCWMTHKINDKECCKCETRTACQQARKGNN